MAEWLKAHAWKACLLERVTWVRIPLSPPAFCSLPTFAQTVKGDPGTRLVSDLEMEGQIPSPSPRATPTPLVEVATAAMSRFPSPLKSAATTDDGAMPTLKLPPEGWNVPSPLPSQ